MTVSIEIFRDGVLPLLSDMARLGLIKVNTLPKSPAITEGTLSDQFAGKLRLSDDVYEAYQNAIKESRNEWTRDIY